MFWLIAGLMSLAAAAAATWPMLRGQARSTAAAMLTIVAVIGLAAGIYAANGRPDVPSGRSMAMDAGSMDIDAMVASLAARLEQQPDDLEGWKMLGRSYLNLGRFDEASAAFERAIALEDAANADTLIDYGVALAQSGGQTISPKAVAAFENAIRLAPTNPNALFWSGIGAANRGDTALAADRWEQLLATDPPAEVRGMLTQRIAAWRGEPVPALPAAHPPIDGNAPAGEIAIDVSVADGARRALGAGTTVFVLARTPGGGGPPIAVTRRTLGELPGTITLSDKDSMLPGRNLSAFEEVEVVVRASASGNPTPTKGDWFGSAVVRPAEAGRVGIAIAEVVP